MPNKCSVPGCKSNYGQEYTTCFRFPNDPEKKNLWINRIRRKDFKWTKNARVCIRHFDESMIVTEDKWTDKNGKVHFIPRNNPCLTPDAFPSIISEETPLLNVSLPKKRKTRDDLEEANIQAALQESVSSFQEEIISNTIKDLEEVSTYFSQYSHEFPDWIITARNGHTALLKISTSSTPCMTVCFKILEDLSFNLYYKDEKVNPLSLGIKFETICEKKNIDFILKSCDTLNSSNPEDNPAKMAIMYLKKYGLSLEEDEAARLNLFIEQIGLLETQKERYRFSPSTYQFAFTMYLTSPACYRAIRKSSLLVLPHPSNLKKMANKLNICGDNFNLENDYIKRRVSALEPREMYVNLLMDEIYIAPELAMKSGKLIGMASNHADNIARTAQVFSITSAFGKYKDVVAILPVSKNSGEFLFEVTKNMLNGLHNIGLKVLSIISDNNQINKSMFAKFTPHSFGFHSVTNPSCPEIPMFTFYDSVHLFKNIRNNWLAKNDLGFIFTYPDFTDFDVIRRADFDHLRALYHKEKNQVLKLGHKLSNKAVYPSNIERQKVSLVCQVFNDENANALKESGINDTEGTSIFLRIIIKWWNIVNVKGRFKHIRFNREDFRAIEAEDQEQLLYLEQMFLWLEKWEMISRGELYKGLSKRTFDALIRTCKALFGLCRYSLAVLKMDFVLLGKFQTDPLEERFGLYRQLSGCNYFISLVQLYESEKKIRVQNMLSFSNQHAQVVIKDLRDLDIPSNIKEPSLEEFSEIFIEIGKPLKKEIVPIVHYVAGYAAFKITNKTNCKHCTSILVHDQLVRYEFVEEARLIDALDRGALKKPSFSTLQVTSVCVQLFDILLEEQYYPAFISCTNHLRLMLALLEPYILSVLHEVEESTRQCSHDLIKHYTTIATTVSKILLNNFSKMQTEKYKLESKSNNRKIAKLTSAFK